MIPAVIELDGNALMWGVRSGLPRCAGRQASPPSGPRSFGSGRNMARTQVLALHLVHADVDSQAAQCRFFVLGAHVKSGGAHGGDDFVEADEVGAVAA